MAYPATENDSRTVVYGAFKGMGDLLSALPVILSELNSGVAVVLLIFPQILKFIELINFGPNRARLQIHTLPVSGGLRSMREFFGRMSRLSPDAIWISPHAPAPASSWKIPLLLWVVKQRYWPAAKLGGADTERMAWLFDVRVPVDRNLPFARREWTAYFGFRAGGAPTDPPAVSFINSIQRARLQKREYDLLIHPGAGAENRKWPIRHYPRLVERIPVEYRIAVLGLPEDVAALQAVLPKDRGITFLTGSLEQSVIAIASARVALTMDSGPAFFAKALGVTAVALFGASDPANVIGFDGTVTPSYEKNWPCQPCGSPICSQKAILCMESLEPETVALEVLRLLSRVARE
jgi:ADP-heptose:LPS heptosyltransferase